MYEDRYDNGDEREFEAEAESTFHAELRRVIEQAENTGLEALVPQAQALLALPEASVAALVTAAQSMVGAASFAQGSRAYVTDEDGSNPRDLYTGDPLDL